MNNRHLNRVIPSVARTVINGGPDAQIELEFGSVGFCGGRKTGEPGEKPSEKGENQQQTQATRDDEYGNRTRVPWSREPGFILILFRSTLDKCIIDPSHSNSDQPQVSLSNINAFSVRKRYDHSM